MTRTVLLATPGDILNEEFIQAMNLTEYAVAKAIDVPPRRINEIVKGQRTITADTALRLSAYFGTTAEFWTNLQAHYDIETKRAEMADKLSQIQPYQAAA